MKIKNKKIINKVNEFVKKDIEDVSGCDINVNSVDISIKKFRLIVSMNVDYNMDIIRLIKRG